MQYTYTVYSNNQRLHICTCFDEAVKAVQGYTDAVITVDDNLKGGTTIVLNTIEDIEEWQDKLSRDAAWKPKKREKPVVERRWNPMENLLDEHTPPEVEKTTVEKAVDPSHYKGYIDKYQWLDAMSKIPTLRTPELFCAALELQIRKYLDRNGGKDASIQELKKARFYLEYMIQYMEGKKVSAAKVHEKLKD